MNRPDNNSLGLLTVFSVGIFVLALVYHMLIGGRGFLAAVFFALIFTLIVAALIYLFLMTSLGMEWSQAARKKIEAKAGEVKGKIDETRAPAEEEDATSSAAETVVPEAAPDAGAEPDTANADAEPAGSTHDEDMETAAPLASAPAETAEEPSAVAPDEPEPVEAPRVSPTRVQTRVLPSESTEPPPVEPKRVLSRRLEQPLETAETGASEDYDRDGVLEGTDEGTRPATLDAPRGGEADDLKMIKGVGPKLEKLLNSLGFWHFDQVASWSDNEVAWVNANLPGFPGRVSRDNWVEQAKTLAAGGETEFSKRVEGGDVY